MNFEEAYKKLHEGTATDEEVAFVARELENVRRISAVLDDPSLSGPAISKAEIETVQKARKAFNHKTLLRTVAIVLGSLLAIAAIVCAILFLPSNISASRKLKLSKEQAVDAAYECLVNEVGEEEAKRFYVDYAHRHLRYTGSIFDAIYVYKIEFEDSRGREYEIEVNSNSGYTVVRDIDF
ncbi:MAG: PepSY domain-containing protein [Oscillospiraceae bacterium]|nr:PepSY domain-containing protein [Oscillospiraceae bacterium]